MMQTFTIHRCGRNSEIVECLKSALWTSNVTFPRILMPSTEHEKELFSIKFIEHLIESDASLLDVQHLQRIFTKSQ